jgi:hypothetical protein
VYNRGLECYSFFWISIGIKRRTIDICKKLCSNCCKMYNVQFFSRLRSKFAKSVKMTTKNFLVKNMGIKNEEVNADF